MAVVDSIRVNPAEIMLIKRGGGTTHMQSLFLRILLLACLTSITITELLSQQSQRSSTPTAEVPVTSRITRICSGNSTARFRRRLRRYLGGCTNPDGRFGPPGSEQEKRSRSDVRQRAIGSGVIVSSVWRQPDPDNPMVYIQTSCTGTCGSMDTC